MERRKIHGGDKAIIYEKMGLVEGEDIEKYKKKLGIKAGIDLQKVENIDQVIEESKGDSTKKLRGFKLKRKIFEQEELKKMVSQAKEEKNKIQHMTEEEKFAYDEE